MAADWELKAKLEALLIASGRAVKVAALAACLEVTEKEVEATLTEFAADLSAADRGVQLRRQPQGVRLETKAPYAEVVGRLIPERRAKPLSSQALETLAIIALKQPVTANDINAIRGVESAGTLHTLRMRKLITRSARLGPHREKSWRTTPLFLDVFNITSLDDLYQEGRLEKAFAAVYLLSTAS